MDKLSLTATISILSLAVLSGCGSKSESYTTDYLYENDDIRAQVLEDCKVNKQSDSNCQNANEAESKMKAKKLRERINR